MRRNDSRDKLQIEGALQASRDPDLQPGEVDGTGQRAVSLQGSGQPGQQTLVSVVRRRPQDERRGRRGRRGRRRFRVGVGQRGPQPQREHRALRSDEFHRNRGCGNRPRYFL